MRSCFSVLVWVRLSCLSVVAFFLLTADSRAQQFPGAPAALEWKDFLKCELVVVAQLKSHDGATLSLEIVDVLSGNRCKPGDVLSVKLSQAFGIKSSTRYGEPRKPEFRVSQIFFVVEQGASFEEIPVVYDAQRPHVYFFPKAKHLFVDRPSQMQPDRRDGWKQALAGKPINVSFRLLHDIDSDMSRESILELFKTRDRQAIADLVDALIEPSNHARWIQTQALAERLLISLGDKNGDVYEPALKALSGTAGQGYSHAYRLGRILARADSKRAVGDFKKLLESGARVSKDGICWCLHCLESEEGLDLIIEQMVAGQSQALYSLCELMFSRQAIAVPMVQRARIQDLAVPRIQKLLKARTLPNEIHSQAMFNENFRSLVEEFPGDQLWRFGHFHNHPVRKGFPEWGRTVYEANNDLEPILKADLIEGRKMLVARLAEPFPGKPYDVAVSQHLAHYYGDMDMAKKFKKPQDPIVRYRDTNTASMHQAPYSVFMKMFKETPKCGDAYWARIIGIYPRFPEEYFREISALIESKNEHERHFAIVHQLQDHFYWNFDLDPKDFEPVTQRKLAAIKPLLVAMSKGDLLHMRATLLRHFGVPLEGPPGKAWLPALRTAALSWNPTLKFNAVHVLGMLEEDPEIMSFANHPLSQRQQALDAHLKNRPALQKERQAATPAQLQALWKDLDSETQATGYAAMQALLAAPQSTVAWFRQHLKEPPPGAGPDPKRCAALIKDLASPTFRVRSQASAELKKMGPGVTPHLRKALKDAPDLETRRRVEDVLSLFSSNDGRYREVRAIQVLEYMPGPEARAFLEELAVGPEHMALTHEAKGALRRLQAFWRW